MESEFEAESALPSSTGEDGSLALVKRLKAGDRSAWEELYLRHHDALLFSIRCQLGSDLRQRVNSEDVLHSVVADALSDIQRFEPRGKGAVVRWLSACALNKIRCKAGYFVAAKRAGDVPLSDSLAQRLARPADQPPCYVDPERWEPLERALEDLDGAQREVVLLRTLEGLSNSEAAARCGRTAAATSKLYNRGLARLGARVGALRDAPP